MILLLLECAGASIITSALFYKKSYFMKYLKWIKVVKDGLSGYYKGDGIPFFLYLN